MDARQHPEAASARVQEAPAPPLHSPGACGRKESRIVRPRVSLSMATGSWLFHTYQDAAGEWRWQLKAANGEIVADSGEGYETLAGVRAAAQRVKDNAGQAAID
jgi:uncharacterized protein YegP (UPF0339 family)